MAFILDWVELVCPRCRSDLEPTASNAPGMEGVLRCTGCSTSWPVIHGIPDLRVFADPYISIEGDRIKGRMLAEGVPAHDLMEMARTYYHITPETPPADVERNLVRLGQAVSRATATLGAWDALTDGAGFRGERLLEVGCGTAPLLIAAADRFRHRVGVDVSFRWLIMAKRRLRDAGMDVPLVAACGEALPFRDEVFDAVAMDSYLEITRDQESAAREAHRVLQAGGRVMITTPNRSSLGPDPHIGVPAGGLLPRAVVDAIARQRMARPPLRQLFTRGRLRRALARAGFTSVSVVAAPLSEAQLATTGALGARLGRLFNALRAAPVAGRLVTWIAPILQGGARRPAP